jgi:hypothetical protein
LIRGRPHHPDDRRRWGGNAGPTVRPRPWVVNVGLPRTGTTSIAQAMRLLGFSALHTWPEGEHAPEILTSFRRGEGPGIVHVTRFELLTDTPFYALRRTFERWFPQTHIIATSRPRSDWIRSMVRHGRAGGRFLAEMYGLRGPVYGEADATVLGQMYDRHHDEVCRNLPIIDLSMPDSEKWRTLCAAFPRTSRTLQRCERWPWPFMNRSPERPAAPSGSSSTAVAFGPAPNG